MNRKHMLVALMAVFIALQAMSRGSIPGCCHRGTTKHFVRVGDRACPPPIRVDGWPGWLGHDPLRGKIGQGRLQRLDLDDDVLMPVPGPAAPLAAYLANSAAGSRPEGRTLEDPGRRSQMDMCNPWPCLIHGG
jgi:hypothetical protein